MNWYRITLVDGTIAFYELDDEGNNGLKGIMTQQPNMCLKINRCIMLINNGNQSKPGFMAVQPKQLNPMFACCEDGQEFLCLSKVVSFGLVDVESEHWDKIYNNVFGESKLIKPTLKLIVPE